MQDAQDSKNSSRSPREIAEEIAKHVYSVPLDELTGLTRDFEWVGSIELAIQAERDAKDSIIEGLRAQLQCDGTNHRFHETSTFEIKSLQCGCGLYYHDARQGEIDALKAELKKQNTESAIQYGKMMIERNHEVASLTTENLALQGALETIREKAITNEIHRLADNALKSAREAGLVKP